MAAALPRPEAPAGRPGREGEGGRPGQLKVAAGWRPPAGPPAGRGSRSAEDLGEGLPASGKGRGEGSVR